MRLLYSAKLVLYREIPLNIVLVTCQPKKYRIYPLELIGLFVENDEKSCVELNLKRIC